MKRVEKTITLVISSRSTFSHSPCLSDCCLHPDIVSSLKEVPTAVHHPEADKIEWAFHAYQQVIRCLSPVGATSGRIVGIPGTTLAAMQHALTVKLPPIDELLKMVPPSMTAANFLNAYQKEGVAFVVAHGGKALLADQMGVGKSRQALALLAIYRWEWPCVIICPSSLKVRVPTGAASLWDPNPPCFSAMVYTDPKPNVVSAAN